VSPFEQHDALFDLAMDHFALSQMAFERGDIDTFRVHAAEHRHIATEAKKLRAHIFLGRCA
jgi:Na+/phosphate symporter